MSSFKAIQISERVYWVGAIDWSIRDFHGYSTSRGTTYNAFLVTGKSPVLIDTVKKPFMDEMMDRIRSVIDPKDIDYIISNHAEMDHSGCLNDVIEQCQPKKVFASKLGISALKEHFELENITEINFKEPLVLGDSIFHCLETRMLHWPDSMFTFLENDGVLFSQDAFGMHLATYQLFADENSKDILRYESAKYFANILLPYAPFVGRLLSQWDKINWNVKILAPDHGPLWRTEADITWVMQLWKDWSQQKHTRKVVVVYDTMWQSTSKMAQAIADGLAHEQVEVKVMPLSGSHRSDVATELLEAGALVVGTPTLNQQMFPTVADTLCYLSGLKPQNLIAQCFGSYGWAPEGTKRVKETLENMKLELVEKPLAIKYVPNREDLEKCFDFGQKIAKHLKSKF